MIIWPKRLEVEIGKNRNASIAEAEGERERDNSSGGCIISTLLDKPGGTDTPHGVFL